MDAALALAAFLTIFVALAAFSLRWGADIRANPGSKEEQLASYGMSWEELMRARPADARTTARAQAPAADLPRAA